MHFEWKIGATSFAKVTLAGCAEGRGACACGANPTAAIITPTKKN
jgi:hypothetical protein